MAGIVTKDWRISFVSIAVIIGFLLSAWSVSSSSLFAISNACKVEMDAGIGIKNSPPLPSPDAYVIWKDTFDTDKGWTGYSSSSTTAMWERGTSYDYHPNYTYGQIIGTNLKTNIGSGYYGYYPHNLAQTYWLESPPIDCSGHTDVLLSIFHHIYIQNSPNDNAFIAVYDGTSWTNIWRNPPTTLYNSTYSFLNFDVSYWAAGKSNFKIRFGLGPTDSSVAYTGWNIDAVYVMNYTPPPLVVKVFTPASGDFWRFGTTQYINWSVSGGMPKYKINISLSLDGGATYPIYLLPSNITQNKEGNSSKTWLVPTGTIDPSNNAVIKVTAVDKEGGVGARKSFNVSGYFSIGCPPPSVNVKGPNGGENWYTGQNYKINYTLGGMWWGQFNVTFWLSSDNGATYPYFIGNMTTTGKGSMTISYEWKIPLELKPASLCRIKILAIGGGSNGSDESDSSFTIHRGINLIIYSPRLGDVWYKLGTYNITWFVDNGTEPYSLDIRLSTDGIIFSTVVVTQYKQNESGYGSYEWTIPSSIIPTPNARLKITATDKLGRATSIISDKFTINSTIINPVQLTLIKPNGGEAVYFNESYFIEWYISEGAAPYNIQIELSTDNGNTYPFLVTSSYSQLTAGAGSYEWMVDAVGLMPSESCRIRVSIIDAVGGETNKTSNSTFGLYYPLSVFLTVPRGGDIWTLGENKRIEWKTSGGKPPYAYNISLSTDSGTTYDYVVTTGTQSGVGNDYYDWTIPTTGIPESLNCRIKISVTQGGRTAADSSPLDFSITKATLKIGNMTGTVKCAKTSLPVGDATIALNITSIPPVVTNPGGFFTITNIPQGTYTYKISAMGYENYSGQVTIQSFMTKDIGTILLNPLGQIKGVLMDSVSKSPLGNIPVKIKLRGTDYSDEKLTLENGSFIFYSIPLGTYDLNVDIVGYFNYSQVVKLTSAGPVKDFGSIELMERGGKPQWQFTTEMMVALLMIPIILIVLIAVVGMRYKKKKEAEKQKKAQFVYPVFTLEQYYDGNRVGNVQTAQVPANDYSYYHSGMPPPQPDYYDYEVPQQEPQQQYPYGQYPEPDQYPDVQEGGYYRDERGYDRPPQPVDAFGYDAPPEVPPPYIPLDYSPDSQGQASAEPAQTTDTLPADKESELRKYEELRNAGILSDEEFEFAKKNLMNKK